jgi:hypothetical protein
MASDSNKVSPIQLKISNPYASGRMIVFADGTGVLVRDAIDYVPQETDDYKYIGIDDTLSGIAMRYYRDKVQLPSHYYWVIADANKIRNPLDLSGWIGKQIVIPNILTFKLANL